MTKMLNILIDEIFVEYTTEEAIDHIGYGKFQLSVGVVCMLSWVRRLIQTS